MEAAAIRMPYPQEALRLRFSEWQFGATGNVISIMRGKKFMDAKQVLFPLPLAGVVVTQRMLDDLQTLGVIPQSVHAFASLNDYALKLGGSLTGLPIFSETSKYWRDPGNWEGRPYLVVGGLSLQSYGLAESESLSTATPAYLSSPSMESYGLTIANFYRERVAAKDPVFSRIPALVKVFADDPGGMNMLSGYGSDPNEPRVVSVYETPYPLNTAWPKNIGLRFNPETGAVEAFDYQAYNRAYPLKTTVSVAGSTPATTGKPRIKGTAAAFVQGAVGAIMSNPTDPDKAAAKILELVEVA